MESVSLNSPIPIPLQTVKIQEMFIQFTLAKLGIARVLQAEGSRKRITAMRTITTMPSLIHSANTDGRPCRYQGPWQGLGLQWLEETASLSLLSLDSCSLPHDVPLGPESNCFQLLVSPPTCHPPAPSGLSAHSFLQGIPLSVQCLSLP